MVGAHQNLNGTHDLITTLLGMVCHPWTSTCYYQDQPTYQIWNLYLHSWRRYEKWYKMSQNDILYHFFISSWWVEIDFKFG